MAKCMWCGAELPPRIKSKKARRYCNAKCRSSYYRKHKPNGRGHKRGGFCEVCALPFTELNPQCDNGLCRMCGWEAQTSIVERCEAIRDGRAPVAFLDYKIGV